jgi:O-antigen/teichoic acid export membrane protein
MSEINLKRNIAFTTGSQAITMLASFVANWYLARAFGARTEGTVCVSFHCQFRCVAAAGFGSIQIPDVQLTKG